jgi:hypothetical protein
MRVRERRRKSFTLNIEAELRGKPECAHYPKCVFVKALRGIPDASYDARVYIVFAAEWIDYAFAVEAHRIHCEVTALQIF